MPQLGESVAEGTIGKWLKQPGDHVDKYEPLLEVITDKVNAEVPSPFEGVLKEILVEEGATVPNNAEIAVIEEAGGAAEAKPEAPATEAKAEAPAAEAKTSFDVVLASVPADKKIAVIKAVREVKAGLGLAEAKAMVEGAPKPVLEGVEKAEAEAAKKKLEDAGGKVELK